MTGLTELPLQDGTTFTVPAEYADRLAAAADWWVSYTPRSGGRVGIQIRGRRDPDKPASPAALLLEWSGQARPSDLHTADHRDQDQRNNDLANLRWATREEQNLNRDHPAAPVRLTDAQWAELAARRPHTSDLALAREYGIGKTTIYMRLGLRRDMVAA